ncbi:MAG TPA: molybdopterin-dependent oxidoreductase [Acidimicrobiales bacterium]|nr:molybdopterin-dependent oxidoreductase [Acidimicrobiales bacterium]
MTATVPDAATTTMATNAEWKPTACILCECNCGIEVRVGADGHTFERIRGDKAHPASKGYTCEKALRLDYYQNGRGERLLSPLRRRPDGTHEEIDWDTAIGEVAARLSAVRDAHGGGSIVYYGGGGQGNHLGGVYGSATLKALGVRYRANAISQEKTGEVLVMGKMFGTPLRGDFEHCEVAFFVGKNPWISHGIPHARTTLKAIAADPARAMIVIDPRVTETAAMADIHLQVRSGRDAWLIAAMAAVLVDEALADRRWLEEHAIGIEPVLSALRDVPIARYCEISGVDEALVRAATRRIAAAASVAVFEDLGVQMNRHSTLVSYLEKLVWLLTGNLGVPGGQYAMSSLGNLLRMSRGELDSATAPVSPVAGAPLIGGLIPCNVVAEEILTDHPDRYRAMIVESGNPLHSVADSQRMREAMRALEVSVCIDVFMTETARQSDYVLPATTQYEKFEATFFNFDFPRNVFQLRRPVLDPPAGPLPEPEIHARLVDALGYLDHGTIDELRDVAVRERAEFASAFAEALSSDPKLAAVAPVVLYRTLGESLPHGAAAAAALWPMAVRCSQRNPEGVARAGFGSGADAGDELFDAIVERPSGVVFTDDTWEATWARIQTDDGLVHVEIPELLVELAGLRDETPPGEDPDWPLLLSAGERRSFTANTILRDPAWRKKDAEGALRVSPSDASASGLADGDLAELTTKRGSVLVTVAVDDSVQPGHVSLPNGLGLDHVEAGRRHQTGVAPNELTASEDRDPWAGTPWHKTVPARLERATP